MPLFRHRYHSMASPVEALSAVKANGLRVWEERARRAVVGQETREWRVLSHPWFLGRPSPVPTPPLEGWERLQRLREAGPARVAGPPPLSPPISAVSQPRNVTLAKRAVRKLQAPKSKSKDKSKDEAIKLPTMREMQRRRAAKQWAEEDSSWMDL